MDTTKLYVEYIVIGMETLGWIVLILISLLKGAMLNFLDYCTKNIVFTIILISVCHILGLITDRASDRIFEKQKIAIKNKYDIQSKTSILVWEHLEEKTFVMLHYRGFDCSVRPQ